MVLSFKINDCSYLVCPGFKFIYRCLKLLVYLKFYNFSSYSFRKKIKSERPETITSSRPKTTWINEKVEIILQLVKIFKLILLIRYTIKIHSRLKSTQLFLVFYNFFAFFLFFINFSLSLLTLTLTLNQ